MTPGRDRFVVLLGLGSGIEIFECVTALPLMCIAVELRLESMTITPSGFVALKDTRKFVSLAPAAGRCRFRPGRRRKRMSCCLRCIVP